MKRGVLQSSPVQQMMAGNPNLWSINVMRPPTMPLQQNSPLLPPPSFFPHHQYMTPTSSSSSSSLPFPPWLDNPDQLPDSWSQLLLGGFVSEEDQKLGMGNFQAKKLENWEEQAMNQGSSSASIVDVKQENSAGSYVYTHANEDFPATRPAWSPVMPPSSPKSCITSFSSNMLDFSGNKSDNRHPPPDRSSECNSSAAAGGGVTKKARVQPAAAAQPTFKVRKEKVGERITALHQLVSPFGKTDTASVLLEAIGYIRFLQSQIEALSLPYLGNGNMRQQQNSVHGERNCIFPEDPGQGKLLNDKCMKRKGGPDQDSNEESEKDLRSRGLCLVPVSCTLQVGSDNGADYWAPALNGGFR